MGKLQMEEFLTVQKGYLNALKTWVSYIQDYGKLMFGTDWPLANYADYIEITKKLIPEKHWEEVFSGTAERVHSLQGIFLPTIP